MGVDVARALQLVRTQLAERGDPDKAATMAAYMKTDMPFYGVQKPDRVPVFRAVRDAFPLADQGDYEALVRALWAEPQREAKYVALQIANQPKRFITAASMPLYTQLITEGAWWDFVDDVAINLVGRVFRQERAAVASTLAGWVDDDDLWLRRAAIIAQIKHKAETDEAWLFDVCRRRAAETEFFIRKAIGWALREYAKTRPQSVIAFVQAHGHELSPLSRREATKHLDV